MQIEPNYYQLTAFARRWNLATLSIFGADDSYRGVEPFPDAEWSLFDLGRMYREI